VSSWSSRPVPVTSYGSHQLVDSSGVSVNGDEGCGIWTEGQFVQRGLYLVTDPRTLRLEMIIVDDDLDKDDKLCLAFPWDAF